ncbi:hypothetical protein [Bifidobacterium myosotis]|uniref:Uncharacterized protein n=1 Tax=Bifidobacterium myosotis TaxID=1630166 RepID=A0A5M9ZI40_9BIFI|nr:hypothetical protein [Bifidobacterium myosotis]KAA8827220.1 hypothetical protein EMO91_09215 [Bifidobacterium myosotis]
MKFKGTVSFYGRTGILTLDVPSVTDGRTTEDYRNFNPVSSYLSNSSLIVRAFNEAVRAFNHVLNSDDLANDDLHDYKEANE